MANPPVEWSEEKNVKWKTALPGEGSGTAIVWDDRVFLLAAVPTGEKVVATPAVSNSGRQGEKPTEKYQFTVLCLDRGTGKIRWQKIANELVPHEGHHRDHSFASASPVTDGSVVIAFFGSRGLYCFDMDGNKKWEKDFGDMQTRNGFGEGASPALHGDTVVVTWDHEGDDDFIVALDKNTGQERWRKPRNEATGWSTPLIVEHGGKAQVIVNATGKIRSYDLENGAEIWSCGGMTPNAIPTPVTDGDTVYVTSGFRGAALFAIKLGRTGDLTGTDAIRWSHDKGTPYVPSPLLAGNQLYVISGNNGMLSCFDVKDGTQHYESERLQGITGVYSSPVAAQDRVYVLGRNGVCLVLKNSPKLEVLASNKLNDNVEASIALAGGELFIRGHEHLYCIAAN